MPLYSTNLGIAVNPAACPPEVSGSGRDDVRLLAIDRFTGRQQHHHFRAIAEMFRPGDVLVVNNSAAIPAALACQVDGADHVIHLAARLNAHRVIVELRQKGGLPDWSALRPGTTISLLNEPGHVISRGSIIRRFHPRSRFWVLETDQDWYACANLLGRPIRYHYVDRPYSMEAYKTIFGRIPGSSEMPSASRPFTQSIVETLQRRGVILTELTLHTTVSSHEIEDGDVDPPLVPEWFNIPAAAQRTVLKANHEGRAVIALGTTVVRALETWAWMGKTHGWTTHLVTPDRPPNLVSGLVTGLHDNFTSHLWLLYAFLSPEHLKTGYDDARRQGYHWHEFGDLSLIR